MGVLRHLDFKILNIYLFYFMKWDRRVNAKNPIFIKLEKQDKGLLVVLRSKTIELCLML